MTRTYNITNSSIWKQRWGKARDAAFKMQDNKWTIAETAIATGLPEAVVRRAAYHHKVPIINTSGRPPYGSIKQAVLEALVGRETFKQLQARTGYKPSSIRSACLNLKIKLIKEEQL
jgi:hypothetical protein